MDVLTFSSFPVLTCYAYSKSVVKMSVKLSVDGQDGSLIAQSTGLRDTQIHAAQLQLYDPVCHDSRRRPYTVELAPKNEL